MGKRPYFRQAFLFTIIAAAYFLYPFIGYLLLRGAAVRLGCGGVFGRPYEPSCQASPWFFEQLELYAAQFKVTILMGIMLFGGLVGMNHIEQTGGEDSDAV